MNNNNKNKFSFDHYYLYLRFILNSRFDVSMIKQLDKSLSVEYVNVYVIRVEKFTANRKKKNKLKSKYNIIIIY